MSMIELLNDCIFFVGGRGAGASFSGGGCTLAAWNDPAQINKDMAKVMTETGYPLSSSLAWGGGTTYPCTVTNNGAGKVRVTYTNGFTSCRINLAAYAEFDATYSSDRYHVIAQAANYVDLELIYSADANCRIAVGGAFDSAQNAWDNTAPGAIHGTTIHSNKQQTYSNGLFTSTWYLGTAGGSLSSKSFKRLCGFTTQPGDGGQITFDGEDEAIFSGAGGINFNAALEAVIFENIIVKKAASNWRVVSNSVYSIRWINCEGNSGDNGFRVNYGRGFTLIGCKADGNTGYGFSMPYVSGIPSHFLMNCIACNNTKNGFYGLGAYGGGIAIGCIAYGNGNGGTKYSGFLLLSRYGCGVTVNCVAYDNGKHGFELTRRNPVAINCIAKDNGQWGFYADTSASELMAPHVSYCCAHGNTSGQFSLLAALPEVNNIEEDPLFVDAAGGDFRPRNPAVLRGGKLDVKGNPTQMGAILQKYQFARRARAANLGKLQIIR